jgi:hypothetical protein
VDGAKSMVSPESGTSIDMPHNESGAEIERAARTKRPTRKAPSPDPERVAGTTNEQIYIPEATDAAATPAPLFPARNKSSAAPARANKRVAKAKKAPPKKSKKSAKKSAKKTSKKNAAKKSAVTKSSSKKPAKKTVGKKNTKSSKKKARR